ncbi:MAG: 23S rRNA (adenine(2503)-C(2))-methyltransferase RlmN [SAR324 cluster bacterium]|nr:23S rRNA (adenine(2503)-C(2))-methyltransferase RlmN [SAR324 cluster bacterium]
MPLTNPPLKQSFFALSLEDLTKVLMQKGLNPSAATILYNYHYKKKLKGHNYNKVSKATLTFLKDQIDFTIPNISLAQEAQDSTVKFLFELEDGKKVESVLIPFHGKYSLCISTQVGCAMNCSFCFTGTEGLSRNLTTAEIVGQFLGAWHWVQENREEAFPISNLVFMGQGEPLHNFDPVKKACEIFLSQSGCSIGSQKITISTAGYLPGLKRWPKEMPPVNLALSLHSTHSDVRSELIPMNKKYPLAEVLAQIESIPLQKKQFVTYEYLLIAGLNDSEDDAKALGELLSGKEAYINLIPFNAFPQSKFQPPSIEMIEAFKKILDGYQVPTLIRKAKGEDVSAACGQLASGLVLKDLAAKPLL